MKEIRLPDSLATSLASGQPWVYRNHVGAVRLATGTWVKIRAGSYTAYGLWDAESQIAVRIFSTRAVPDSAWWLARVREAWELREPVRARGVTGFRWIFGEADQLPGLVVDFYDGVAVLVTYSDIWEKFLSEIVQALTTFPQVKTVVRRSRKNDKIVVDVLAGSTPPEQVVIQEGRLKLRADIYEGQKTGLFFDHRDNRAFVARYAQGARVLNLFSYTGGFSVAAAQGGAREVTSVDISAPAISACSANFQLNGLESFPHEGIAEDVFRFLEGAIRQAQKYELIVCDPPSFAKSRAQLHAAEKAYTRLLSLALQVAAPGALFCAASCTSQVGPARFRQLLADAARKAKVRFQIINENGQPDDHPVLVAHEEGRYLKFIAGRVLPRC